MICYDAGNNGEKTMKKSPDLSKPPENCPICNGETEWYENLNGKWTAVCHFCNHIFVNNVKTEIRSK